MLHRVQTKGGGLCYTEYIIKRKGGTESSCSVDFHVLTRSDSNFILYYSISIGLKLQFISFCF